jgi:hypothetical protein
MKPCNGDWDNLTFGPKINFGKTVASKNHIKYQLCRAQKGGHVMSMNKNALLSGIVLMVNGRHLKE